MKARKDDLMGLDTACEHIMMIRYPAYISLRF